MKTYALEMSMGSSGVLWSEETAYTHIASHQEKGHLQAVAVVNDMKVWPMAVQNAMRNNGSPAGGSGIGEENGPTFTLRADGGHPPSVAIVENEVKCFPICTQAATRDADKGNRCGVGMGADGDPASTLRTGAPPSVALAFDAWSSTVDITPEEERSPCMKCGTRIGVARSEAEEEMDEPKYVVRRITPVEAERLQGFPDNYTNVEFKGKPAPDTARYKALGNSMTTTVMKWIAKRILMVEKGEL